LKLFLPLNSERRIHSRRFEIDFFDLLDARETRAGGQVMLERFNRRRRTLGHGFHRAVGKVPDVANNLVPGRGALRKKSVTDALHVSAD
jgi:hypothetical protein